MDIIQKDNKIIRGKASEIPLKDIKSSKIKKAILALKKALEKESDGVAIAAPSLDSQYLFL